MGFWVRKPIGVVIGITGFNYPLLLASHKIAPALAAGCPIIVKPAPQTPLATLWLVHLFRESLTTAGAPAEAIQLITGGADVGSTLTTDRKNRRSLLHRLSLSRPPNSQSRSPHESPPRTRLQLSPGRSRRRRPGRRSRRHHQRRLLRLRPSLHLRPARHSSRPHPSPPPPKTPIPPLIRSSRRPPQPQHPNLRPNRPPLHHPSPHLDNRSPNRRRHPRLPTNDGTHPDVLEEDEHRRCPHPDRSCGAANRHPRRRIRRHTTDLSHRLKLRLSRWGRRCCWMCRMGSWLGMRRYLGQ